MKMQSPESKSIIDYVQSVSVKGPSHAAYDGLRVFHHRERMLHFLTGNAMSITPVTVEMWPSLSCNARCPTCPYRLSGARSYADSVENLMLLDPNLSREVVSGAALAHAQSVIFTGGGEPLLHPEIVRIAADAVQAGLAWAMFTNGLLLQPSLARQLLNLKPRFLRVSLDAGSPEYYSHVYALPRNQFEIVLGNIVSTAQIARECNSKSFGLGFTFEPQIGDTELRNIRRLLEQLLPGEGIGLVAFRPRVIHYRASQPLCPQPSSSRYVELSERIKGEIIQPLKALANKAGTRLDIKEGLFHLASQEKLQSSCLSSSWMTNIDQEGNGYITAELAGAPDSKQRWGLVQSREDFLREWEGPSRKRLHDQLVSGDVPVPLVHRTSPLDAVLHDVKNILSGHLSLEVANEVLDSVVELKPCSSKNNDFV